MAYYEKKLSGERMRECYRIAPPRVRQYLDAEIAHVLERLRSRGSGGSRGAVLERGSRAVVLELGCAYGRVMTELAKVADRVVGIDTASGSLRLGRELVGSGSRYEFLEMDAVRMAFPDGCFDAVVCIQNGICAFNVDKVRLVREAVRVTRPCGIVLFSSYAGRFWDHRLEWFRVQSEAGLLGEIDEERTRDGVIVCKDGFSSGMMTPSDFRELCAGLDLDCTITGVDNSSTFCEINVT